MSPSNDLSATPLSVADVTLVVRDLATVSRFYQQAIGLQPLATDRAEHVLGAGDQALLRLRADPGARRPGRRAAGLFHTAFLLPSRPDLGAWLRHTLAQKDARITGASDHAVSEALYLHDPEGNGIEVYVDRPREQWTRQGGWVEMTTEPLDVDDLLGQARSAWRGAPAATRIGHVHLQVGDTVTAESFYRDGLGFAVTHRRPGATFFATGGYHHQLAANVWNSQGATPRDPATTGLAALTLATPRGDLLEHTDASAIRHDPWGIAIELTRASAPAAATNDT
ncbi:VOC family protein [Endozoicomonas sp. G2_2]|uniref:VOC family protein n=1 Tax=Endozoicomonas sp. G2_2 TaxID=2821092 RepID=UPI001ADA0D4C|nr:VOC family protein [Endozoicomonas sp. G2_2]MBO9470888.1 VOC family protein [Endozoicomonas sp. G2_2]